MRPNPHQRLFNKVQSKVDEAQPKDFLSEICIRWQQALDEAVKHDIPVTITRFGVVLAREGGMLKKLYPSFYLGAGSQIGHGNQVLSWVYIDDLVRAYDYLIDNPELQGPVHVTSPKPCRQKEFAKAFAATLNRPLWLTTPAWVIRLLFGEMGDALINHGQRVVPQRLTEHGFVFQYPEIDAALAQAYHK